MKLKRKQALVIKQIEKHNITLNYSNMVNSYGVMNYGSIFQIKISW